MMKAEWIFLFILAAPSLPEIRISRKQDSYPVLDSNNIALCNSQLLRSRSGKAKNKILNGLLKTHRLWKQPIRKTKTCSELLIRLEQHLSSNLLQRKTPNLEPETIGYKMNSKRFGRAWPPVKVVLAPHYFFNRRI